MAEETPARRHKARSGPASQATGNTSLEARLAAAEATIERLVAVSRRNLQEDFERLRDTVNAMVDAAVARKLADRTMLEELLDQVREELGNTTKRVEAVSHIEPNAEGTAHQEQAPLAAGRADGQ